MKSKLKSNGLITLWMILILSTNSCRNNEQVINSNYLRVNDTTCVWQGVSYKNLSENISLKLDSVPNDSRCPIGAMCVWQGNAVTAFTFTKGNVKHSFSLNTLSAFKTDTVLENYNIKLVKLSQPDIYSDKRYAYTATVLISK
jgi:hypothetical protein